VAIAFTTVWRGDYGGVLVLAGKEKVIKRGWCGGSGSLQYNMTRAYCPQCILAVGGWNADGEDRVSRKDLHCSDGVGVMRVMAATAVVNVFGRIFILVKVFEGGM